LGIVGAGRIGSALAQRCAGGFGMHVLYTDRRENAELERSLGARRVDLDALLADSDFVSLHVPLGEGTRHLIGRRELALMKPTAVLVNTARGPVVDEQALIECLRAGKIFAAGLDVFEHEPEVPDALRRLENAVILPHIGSASFETRARMAVIAAENITAVLEGRPALNPVNP
ncbi:MAG: NAD(P)-dependent oxidoreductase, partial [Bacteroidota bacterium]|nr:NAD(P)-dependent oxidoreductase [Bacteroidota bacterium]